MSRRALFLVVVLAAVATAAWLLLRRGGPTPSEETLPSAGESTAAPAPLTAGPAARPSTPTSTAEAPERARIDGLVLDVEGRPVAEAHVTLFAHAVALSDEVLAEGAGVGVAAKSDAAGRFVFEGVDAGAYSILARREGVGVGSAPAVRVAARGAASVTLRLAPEASVEGRVTTEDGKPVASARIEADAASALVELYRRLDQDWFRGSSTITTTSGADGRFRLAPLSTGTLSLRVSAPGHVSRTLRAVAAPSKDVQIVLRAAGSIRVVVSAGSATPPDEVTLRVTPVSGPAGAARAATDARRRTTGSETSVAIGGLAPDRYEVRATAVGWAAASGETTVVAGSEAAPLRLSIAPGTPIRGRVLEKESGRPLEGASVALAFVERSAGGWSTTTEATVRSDAGGRWQATIRPGEWDVVASLEGYASEPAGPVETRHVVVGAAPVERDLVLVAAPAIVGRVETTDGDPVRAATVRVVSASSNPAIAEGGEIGVDDDMEGETDADGRFRIEGVVAYAKYGLEAVARDGGRATLEGVVFEPGKTETAVRLRLDPASSTAGRIEGRVVAEDGVPVAGALLRIGGRGATSDTDGRFLVERVPPGRHRGRVAAIGYAVTFPPAVVVVPRETAHPEPWVLRRSGLVVEGRVTDAAGRAVEDAEVWTAFPAPGVIGVMVVTATDPSGRYRLEGPADKPSPIHVTIRAQGFDIVNRTVTPQPIATLDVVLVKKGALVTRIDARGPAPTSIGVLREYALEGGSAGLMPVELTYEPATGDARLLGVPAGRHTLRITAPGFAPTKVPDVDVREGETTTLPPIVLTPGGTVSGRILDASGKPLAGVQVGFEAWFLYTDTDADGRFRIAHAPPGTWSLYVAMFEVDGRDWKDYPRFSVTVEEGKTADREQRVR